MGVTYGFYDSIGGDRAYSATQLSSLFDGIINDGVFMSIGDALVVIASTGMNVIVGSGRAWFNKTWTNNDGALVLVIAASESVLNRIDMVVLETDMSEEIRANTIKVIKGTPGSSPIAPTLVNTEFVHQYPLAHIYVGAGVTSIITANITNKIGTIDCPFITGILETVDISDLLTQWDSEFHSWMDTLADILDENTAGNLLNLIDDHIADYVRNPAFGPATGVVDAYTFSAMSATSLVDGMSVYLDNVIAANTGASTFNWSGLGVKAIVDAKGAALTAGKMPLSCIVGLRYNASTSSFQLLGEGGETLTGDMVAGDLLAGKTGYSNDPLTKITGTKDLSNLSAGNIKSGVVIAGITGTLPDGTGKVGYANGNVNPASIGNVLTVTGMAFRPTLIMVGGSITGGLAWSIMRDNILGQDWSAIFFIEALNGLHQWRSTGWGVPPTEYGHVTYAPNASGFTLTWENGYKPTGTIYWHAVGGP